MILMIIFFHIVKSIILEFSILQSPVLCHAQIYRHSMHQLYIDFHTYTSHSQACQRVVRWISVVAERVRDTLDGHNVESALLELGLRLHRTILDHLMKFEYSATGIVLLYHCYGRYWFASVALVGGVLDFFCYFCASE